MCSAEDEVKCYYAKAKKILEDKKLGVSVSDFMTRIETAADIVCQKINDDPLLRTLLILQLFKQNLYIGTIDGGTKSFFCQFRMNFIFLGTRCFVAKKELNDIVAMNVSYLNCVSLSLFAWRPSLGLQRMSCGGNILEGRHLKMDGLGYVIGALDAVQMALAQGKRWEIFLQLLTQNRADSCALKNFFSTLSVIKSIVKEEFLAKHSIQHVLVTKSSQKHQLPKNVKFANVQRKVECGKFMSHLFLRKKKLEDLKVSDCKVCFS